jgi:hypothetical protein
MSRGGAAESGRIAGGRIVQPLSGLGVVGAGYPGWKRLALVPSRFDPYMFSGYDFLVFSHTRFFLQSHTGMGVLLAALFHGGERSEPEWNSAARSRRQTASPVPVAVLLPFGYCVPLDLLLFLRRQEHEAAALAQRAIGGVRELVQPSDDLGSVRSPARAAHARCSKLERLPERRPGPSARISKDE